MGTERIKTKFTAGDSFPRIACEYIGADPVVAGLSFSLIVDRPGDFDTIELSAAIVNQHEKGGTYRFDWRTATLSTVTVDLNIDALSTIPIGTIVESASTGAQFVTTAAANNAGGSPAVVSVLADALIAGPLEIPASDVTVIPTPVVGLLSVDNPAAGTPGIGDDLVEGCNQKATIKATLPTGTQHVARLLLDVLGRPL